MIGLLSCSSELPPQQDETATALAGGLKALASEYNTEIKTGSLIVSYTTEGEVVLAADTEGNDNLYEPGSTLYFLQTAHKSQPKSFSIAGSWIRLPSGLLVVDNASGSLLLYSVNDADVLEALQADISRVVGVRVSTLESGFGFGQIELHFDLPRNFYEANPSFFAALAENAPENSGIVQKSGSCNSGGEGATSCSCCGCSVSCGNGYYACCNYSEFRDPTSGCRCVIQPPTWN